MQRLEYASQDLKQNPCLLTLFSSKSTANSLKRVTYDNEHEQKGLLMPEPFKPVK